MSKLMFKYEVESRGREGRDNTWIINNLDNNEKTLTDHIELKVPVTTEEKQLGLGFGMVVYGQIEWRKYPDSDKKFVVIIPEEV